ncbi:TRAP transporter substrate-binding protein [Thalassospira sp. MCCC 1A01428]|jgi:tripartite ATP-independent transporter DctP family solute receptor|uniref:TRAP transporter substrate-binding protein n=1 Tax=Thalassospira sp. MCCC 1A01428 TaxID=1470575 RepID=UPI000A1DFC33|nr:TRAP transporter substrate-binding protein [Thalassospira sp. MCCC 1A01428]OSQ37592.1 hypothetical protein THS27_22595 [Thalassospira sp. MCCC 1A01428]|tara:strand:- start:5842 stop:6837 length:996 start_codon:yes stop_codon:yes gene_type:complete
MKTYTKICGLLAGFILSASATTACAEPLMLTLGHAVFKTHPFNDAAERFAKAVDEKSDGQIKIDIYPARQMGDVKELMEGVQLGTIDMTINSSSALSTLAPSVDAFQLPYVMRDYDDFARMAVSPQAQAIMDKLKDHGMIGLGLYEGGQRHFLSTGKPIKDISDFKGLKTRVAPSELFLDIWNSAGVNPTPMAYGEVYSGLETGTIDAVEINLTSIQSEGLYDAAKNVTLIGHYFWPGILLVNKGIFDGLTADQQKILREAAREVVKPQVMAVKAYDEKLKSTLKDEGVTVTEASDNLKKELHEAWAPVIQKYSERNPLIADFVTAAEAGH